MTISILIPVLNEEQTIHLQLNYLLDICLPNYTKEIIIVDGGSTDCTLEILKSYPSVKVIQSTKGRAIQMNNGAKNATSDVLYFLHCDTFPPPNFDAEIVNQIQKGNHSGCFTMKFDSDHIVLKVSQWFTKFNHISCRGGDQSLFVKRYLFEKLGGFDENLLLYEDNEFISRLYKNSKFTVIQKSVTTSARKYRKNGFWRLQFHFIMIHLMYWLKFKNETIVDYYKKNIK